MKYIIILILLSFKGYAQDNWHIGMSLGLRYEKAWDNKTKSEKFGATNFLFNVPVSYQNKWFIGELSAMYSGDITASLSGGFVLPISEKVSLQLMGGVADNLYPSFKPMSLTHKFYPTAIGRLQIGTFFLQAQQIDKVSFFGIGLRGLMSE